jgi:hypothetical protein
VDEFSMQSGVAPSPGAAGHLPVLVNHSADRWSSTQREAALGYAPEICDFPFLPVAPETEAVDIADLAERTVEDVVAAYPGVTHPMVQGEFTLALALVLRLQRRGVVCLSATTKREVLDENGDTKTSRFDFVRLREYL